MDMPVATFSISDWRPFLQAAPVPLLISLASEGTILYANPELARLVGVPPKALIGRPALSLYADHEEGAAIRALLQDGNPVENQEIRIKKAVGTEWWVSESSRTLAVGDNQVVVSIYMDLSPRKKIEAENHDLHEQLLVSQKMEAVGRLAGGIAHDFNNLLTVIKGYSEIVLSGLPAAAPQRPDIEHICHATKRAAALTQQLLAFSRHRTHSLQPVNMPCLVHNLADMLQRLLGEHIELITAVPPSALEVEGDPGQLEQVIMNLVVNARDAMPKGGKLTIEVSPVNVTESGRRGHPIPPGQYVQLTVTDTGCGMDAPTKARIFEPFFTTKEIGQGTGLGLATVYGIITQHAGHVAVYSEPGYGATFKIYLPRIEMKGDEPPMAPSAPDLPRGRERILVVEDEPAIRSLVVHVLEAQGYVVLQARHAIEGLIVAAECPEMIHLLITDILMPQMNGGELAHRLVESHSQLKVLYMSGYSESGVIQNGLVNPGTAFLPKPFDLTTLLQKVRKVLDQ